MTIKEKKLLGAIDALQWLVGRAKTAMHDRNPNRQAEVQGYLERAHKLAIEVRGDYTTAECEKAAHLFDDWTKEEQFF